MFGSEMAALTQRQEGELEVAELKMLIFSLGVTKMDRMRNKQITEGQHRLEVLQTKLEKPV